MLFPMNALCTIITAFVAFVFGTILRVIFKELQSELRAAHERCTLMEDIIKRQRQLIVLQTIREALLQSNRDPNKPRGW